MVKNYGRQIFLLHCIYEGGQEYKDCCQELFGFYNEKYTRVRARELITSYLNKFISSKEGVHPLGQLDQKQSRELCEYLETEMNGGKIKINSDGPSVF